MPDVSAACDDTRHQARVAGEVLGAWKALDVADLKPDERGKDLTDAWNGLQQPDLGDGLRAVAMRSSMPSIWTSS